MPYVFTFAVWLLGCKALEGVLEYAQTSGNVLKLAYAKKQEGGIQNRSMAVVSQFFLGIYRLEIWGCRCWEPPAEGVKGDDWWVHHGRNLQQYEKNDPLRNWEKGTISRMDPDGSGFWVEHPYTVRYGKVQVPLPPRLFYFATHLFHCCVPCLNGFLRYYSISLCDPKDFIWFVKDV